MPSRRSVSRDSCGAAVRRSVVSSVHQPGAPTAAATASARSASWGVHRRGMVAETGCEGGRRAGGVAIVPPRLRQAEPRRAQIMPGEHRVEQRRRLGAALVQAHGCEHQRHGGVFRGDAPGAVEPAPGGVEVARGEGGLALVPGFGGQQFAAREEMRERHLGRLAGDQGADGAGFEEGAGERGAAWKVREELLF